MRGNTHSVSSIDDDWLDAAPQSRNGDYTSDDMNDLRNLTSQPWSLSGWSAPRPPSVVQICDGNNSNSRIISNSR